MRTKKFLFTYPILFFFLTIPILNCNDKGINTSFGSVEYLSFKDNGCTKALPVPKTNADTIFSYGYYEGLLKLTFLFNANCNTVCKDSVVVLANIIKIYLQDVSKSQVRCFCPIQEDFTFRTERGKEIFIQFFYKAYGKNEYSLIVDRTIKI